MLKRFPQLNKSSSKLMSWIKKHRHELLIFFVLIVCYSYFFPRWANWSQNSRLNLVFAMVDDGTLHIDKYYQSSGDYFCYNREIQQGGCDNGGHYYSDKAPGAAFLAAPVYAAVRPILHSAPVQGIISRLSQTSAFSQTLNEEGSGLQVNKVYWALVLYIVTIVTVGLPSALIGVLLFKFLEIFNPRPGWRIAVALIYGLVTNAFPYSGSFYGHQIVAFLLFGAFYIAFLISQRKLSAKWITAIGLMLAYAFITEYPTALIAGAVLIYALWALPDRQSYPFLPAHWKLPGWRSVLALLLAGLLPGILLMVYDWQIFGSIFPLGYNYSELYKDNVHSEGILSLTGPNLNALWGITFSSFRGLFFVSPVLLLGIVGLVLWAARKQWIPELAVCAWSVFSFFLFNGSSVMWQGGFSIGPRYLLPMVPFLAVGLGVFVVSLRQRWLAKGLVALLTAWSTFVIWVETIGGQSFPDWTLNPLFNYSLPKFLSGDIARNIAMALDLSGFASLVPLISILGLLALFYLFLSPKPEKA